MIQTIGVMMRFASIFIPQADLESGLGCAVQWSRKNTDGRQHAQVDVQPDGERVDWAAIERFLEEFGERIGLLAESGAALEAELDIGLPFYETGLMSSVTVPGRICYLAGRNGISVTIRYYATSEDSE